MMGLIDVLYSRQMDCQFVLLPGFAFDQYLALPSPGPSASQQFNLMHERGHNLLKPITPDLLLCSQE